MVSLFQPESMLLRRLVEACCSFAAAWVFYSLMNALFAIAPYKFEGLWVFDDPAKGLVKEPFVGGAEDIIEQWVNQMPNAENGFVAIFSAEAFPGYNLKLTWLRKELSGNVYRCEELGSEGWLCPALLRYFDSPPMEIYAQAKARN